MGDVLRPVLDQIGKLWARVNLMPVVRWGTVTQASPLRVRLDGDADPLPFTPATTVRGLRPGNRVVCVEQHRRITVITHADTGWVALTPAAGFSGEIRYRVSAGLVAVEYDLTGSVPTGFTTLAASAIPSALRPTGNRRGVGYLAGGYAATSYVLASSGILTVAQQSGAARTNPSGSVFYFLD